MMNVLLSDCDGFPPHIRCHSDIGQTKRIPSKWPPRSKFETLRKPTIQLIPMHNGPYAQHTIGKGCSQIHPCSQFDMVGSSEYYERADINNTN